MTHDAPNIEQHDIGLLRPEVPGYLIHDLLGIGGSSAVWAATDSRERHQVAVKVIDAAAGSESAELAVLRSLRHPHVLQLIEDITLADGRLALVLELASGGSLARIVRARGHLTPGETVTVLASLGSTVADLHRLGITHADLSPANVIFHADGRPMLADLGLTRVAGNPGGGPAGTAGFVDPAVLAGAAAGPWSDVYGLGAIGWLALTGSAPGHAALRPRLREQCPLAPEGLVDVVERALDPDPAGRPGAAELASAVYRASVAEPVHLAGGGDRAEELTHRIRAQAAADATTLGRRPPAGGWPRRLRLQRPARPGPVAVLIWALAVVTLGAALTAWRAPSGPPRAQPSWSAVATALATARASAFAGSPVGGPAQFDAVGSAAWRADQMSLDELRAAGVHYRGLQLSVARVRLVARGAATAGLELTVATSAYDIVVTATGVVWEHRSAARATTVRLDLVHTATGWRVSQIR